MDEQNQPQSQELDKKERRELKRQEEEQQLAALSRKRKIKKISKWGGVIVILVAVVFGAYKWAKDSEADKPGEAISEQPAVHIQPGEPLPGIYLSNPPVSGWHYSQPAEWGAYDKELPDQTLIHNLEHGGIWISYHPDAPPEVVDKLKEITASYGRKVILTPRAANTALIALAAWGRLDKFDYLDEARIKKFIKAYKDKGPEFVP